MHHELSITKKADLYDMLWKHICKELAKDPRHPKPVHPRNETAAHAEAVYRWDFWARLWYALRERMDVGRYPDAVRSTTTLDETMPITDLSHHELLVAYYG